MAQVRTVPTPGCGQRETPVGERAASSNGGGALQGGSAVRDGPMADQWRTNGVPCQAIFEIVKHHRFPFKNTIFTVSKSSKHRQNQAFRTQQKLQKHNFSCDDVFAAVAVAVVVIYAYIYIYVYTASPSSSSIVPQWVSRGDLVTPIWRMSRHPW